MSLYERFAARPGGLRLLAEARLRYEALGAIQEAAEPHEIRQLAALAGLRLRRARAILLGDRVPTINELAALLHAAGYEAELTIVPAGEPRRRALEEAEKLT